MLLFLYCSWAYAAETPKKVLLLDSYGRSVTPVNTVISVFRTALSARSTPPVDIQIVSLEMARFGHADRSGVFVEFLGKLFTDQRPDLLVTIGGPAAKFALEHQDQLFPGTPKLLAAAAEQVLKTTMHLDNTVVAPLQIDLGNVVENILRLLPKTSTVSVILGTSALETFWIDECRRAFAPYSDRVHFEYLDQLSLDAIQRRVATLPADTAVFYGMLIVDKAGTIFDPAEALKLVIEHARVPVFVLHESFFGYGAVGGRLIPEHEAGTRAADIAQQLLAGIPAARIQTASLGLSAPQYDWRMLQRWHIDPSRLPADATIRFHQPSLWKQYGGGIIAGLILLLLQSFLIARLFIQSNRLRSTKADLAGSEQRLRRIADSLPALIAQVDQHQRYRYLNQAYRDWFDILPEKATGHTIQEVIGPALYRIFAANVDRALAGERVHFVTEIELKGGRRRCIEAFFVPDFASQGTVSGFYIMAMDVTEREQALQESRRLYDQLLHAGRISTMGELAGALAHEINQPLSAIMSNAQAAKRFLDASALDEVKEILPDIAGEAARAGQVINRLRALLKNTATALEPIDLNRIIMEVVGLLKSDAVGRNVIVETDPGPKLPLVRGDRIQLEQVVMNLMINALEAMEGQPRTQRWIRIRTAATPSQVTVALRDSGSGVAADALEKIFDPYFTSKPEGMGMGLSICHSIIHRHRGRIWAENNVEGGATFYFTLPAT